MAKPSWDEIRSRVRRVIAEDKGYDPLEVQDSDRLRDDLRYSAAGLRAVTPDINDEFFVNGKGLSVEQVASCLKVIGISAKVDEQAVSDFR